MSKEVFDYPHAMILGSLEPSQVYTLTGSHTDSYFIVLQSLTIK